MRHKHNNHNSNKLIDALAALEAAEERIGELLYQIENLKIDNAALERQNETLRSEIGLNDPTVINQDWLSELEIRLMKAALEGTALD